jgi:hypothetical protein
MLNRGALIVRPAEPYLAWAKSVFDDSVAPSPSGEKMVYLVPDDDADRGVEWVLRQVWGEVFERELGGWCTDEARWPQRRTLAMFKKWFRIEYHTVVEDLCGWPLEDDEVGLTDSWEVGGPTRT